MAGGEQIDLGPWKSREEVHEYVTQGRLNQGLPEVPDPDSEGARQIAAVVRRSLMAKRGAA